ncbi:glycosyltransferase family 2 protein [Neolewinella agarilytica]|uniref:Glycosyltransferase, GT2 family n=1 Tax=Neolewinella agarilytica TaxID=478744 RepID=A0A1H9J2K8_9BACT|nr:glycosyltransferase [Neolewinella agarilytica]SEQ81063.1 Glycosyltransferase, GT2 family [Neolewinella agarilytica]
MKLSVVVTTFKRPDLLSQCLEGLTKQTANKSDYEVIVIDNAGDAESERMVKERGFKYVYEKKTGHSYARNRGLQESKAPWVLYFDDDTIIPEKTIKDYISFLPKIKGAAFGGRFTHWYECPPPKWLQLLRGDGSRPGANVAFGVLGEEEYLIGCFFGVRKEVALKIGAFDPKFGMKGFEVGWADETELQYRMRKAGHSIYYAPEICIEHLLQPWKCSVVGQVRFAYSHGKNCWLPNQRVSFSFFSLVKYFSITTFITIPVTLGRWIFRHREWYWQNAFLIVMTKYAYFLGRFTNHWTIKTRSN